MNVTIHYSNYIDAGLLLLFVFLHIVCAKVNRKYAYAYSEACESQLSFPNLGWRSEWLQEMASAITVVMPPPHMGQGEWARNLSKKVGRESSLDGGTQIPSCVVF